MSMIQYAWMIYAAGSLGCCIAAWWMFLWAWRFIRYSAVITVMTILCTPYAIDQQTMQMAPAIYTLVFNGMALGGDAIMPLVKLMVGIWLIGIILVLLYVLLTRNSSKTYTTYTDMSHHNPPHSHSTKPRKQTKQNKHNKQAKQKISPRHNQKPQREYYPSDNLSREERQARDEMMRGDVPMRAIRD